MRQFISMASAAAILAAAAVAQAATPVFDYSFPASWSSGTTVTDLSTAGNTGKTNGTMTLTATVPPGAVGGTESMDASTGHGAAITNAKKLLNNATVAAAGGYEYNVDFMWNGAAPSNAGWTSEKIIDYAGTESLQIDNWDVAGGTANVDFIFTDTDGTNDIVTASLASPIQANKWYSATATFQTSGGVAVDGSISGFATLTVTNLTDALAPDVVGPLAATKTTYGDGLNRPIGIGELGSTFGYIVNMQGDIYNPSVNLVPEPASLSLLALAGLPMLRRRRKA